MLVYVKVSQGKRYPSLTEVASFHGSFVAGKPDPAMLVSDLLLISCDKKQDII